MEPEKASTQISSQKTVIEMPGRSVALDLDKEIDELHRSSQWETGIARKVLVGYPDFQITLRTMKADTRIGHHHNPGRICVQTVRGHLQMHADDKLFDLPQGSVLVLDRAVPHDVEALEESAFLLTVAYPENAAR